MYMEEESRQKHTNPLLAEINFSILKKFPEKNKGTKTRKFLMDKLLGEFKNLFMGVY